MLLKPSYTTQESEKVCSASIKLKLNQNQIKLNAIKGCFNSNCFQFDDDPDVGGGGVLVGNHIEPRKVTL